MSKTINEGLITRVEVIDETGRAYVRHEVRAELSVQDGGRTLKVFVGERNPELEGEQK